MLHQRILPTEVWECSFHFLDTSSLGNLRIVNDYFRSLATRVLFKWTILRPGGLNNNPGIGKGAIGRTHITQTISVGP